MTSYLLNFLAGKPPARKVIFDKNYIADTSKSDSFSMFHKRSYYESMYCREQVVYRVRNGIQHPENLTMYIRAYSGEYAYSAAEYMDNKKSPRDTRISKLLNDAFGFSFKIWADKIYSYESLKSSFNHKFIVQFKKPENNVTNFPISVSTALWILREPKIVESIMTDQVTNVKELVNLVMRLAPGNGSSDATSKGTGCMDYTAIATALATGMPERYKLGTKWNGPTGAFQVLTTSQIKPLFDMLDEQNVEKIRGYLLYMHGYYGLREAANAYG